MPCHPVKMPMPDGTVATGYVCTRGRRVRCADCSRLVEAHVLCDWKCKTKSGTCDRKVCRDCAREVGPDKHLCQPHAARWAAHPKNPEGR